MRPKKLWFPTQRQMKTRRIVVFLAIALGKRLLKFQIMMSLKVILLLIRTGQTTSTPRKKSSYLPRELSSNLVLRSTSFNSHYLLKLCRGLVLNSWHLRRFKEPVKFPSKPWVKIHRFMDHSLSTQVTSLNH